MLYAEKDTYGLERSIKIGNQNIKVRYDALAYRIIASSDYQPGPYIIRKINDLPSNWIRLDLLREIEAEMIILEVKEGEEITPKNNKENE